MQLTLVDIRRVVLRIWLLRRLAHAPLKQLSLNHVRLRFLSLFAISLFAVVSASATSIVIIVVLLLDQALASWKHISLYRYVSSVAA